MITTNLKNKLLLPKRNSVFQLLFGQKGAETYTADFLTSIMGLKIETVEYVSKTLYESLDAMEDGIHAIDMKTVSEEGKTIYISMMIGVCEDNVVDMLAHCKELRENTYGKDALMAAIILWEDAILKGYDQRCRTFAYAFELDKAEETIGVQYIHLYNADKKQPEGESKTFLQWIEFMNHPNSEKVEQIAMENEAIRQAKEKLTELSADLEVQTYEAMDRIARKYQVEGAVSDEEEAQAIETIQNARRKIMEERKIGLQKEVRKITDTKEIQKVLEKAMKNGEIKSITVIPKNRT